MTAAPNAVPITVATTIGGKRRVKRALKAPAAIVTSPVASAQG